MLERKDRLYIARGEGIRVIAGKNTIRIGLMLMMYAYMQPHPRAAQLWNTLDSCAPLLLLLAAAAGLLLLLACTRNQKRGTCPEESLQCLQQPQFSLIPHHTTPHARSHNPDNKRLWKEVRWSYTYPTSQACFSLLSPSWPARCYWERLREQLGNSMETHTLGTRKQTPKKKSPQTMLTLVVHGQLQQMSVEYY